jgi:predicted glycosyltransferase
VSRVESENLEARPVRRPSLLFYCQHSLGLGHAVRSFALAEGLSDRFRVVLACGGELPDGLSPPTEVDLLELPALRAARNGELVSGASSRVEDIRKTRRDLLLHAFRSLKPAVVAVELFPFGRRRFADELVPLLEEALTAAPRPLIVSSVRDILVGRGPDQSAHDSLACVLANRYLDAVLVHSDPRFARFDESFEPAIPLYAPLRHTGFVARDTGPEVPLRAEPRVIVSAGGGLVGAPLLRAAVEARDLLPADLCLEIVAGPFLPENAWSELQEVAATRPGIDLHRFVPDLGQRLRTARASVSQCGYNTALDVIRARVPALVVPFAEGREDEQARRATRLAEAGALRMLEAEALSPETLAHEINELLHFKPQPLDLDFDGAEVSVIFLSGLVRGAMPSEAAAP